MDWFLHDRDIRRKRINVNFEYFQQDIQHNNQVDWLITLNRYCKPEKIIIRYLLVQSKQWEHQNNVWNLFKINKKGTKKTSF